jgi:ATP-binding cassette subfamily F protein 3
MIQLDKISRRFGRQLLFEGLSWRIPPGGRIGLVGPNGVGKTTLLRIISGQDQPDEGQVHRAGTVRIGYLPQEVETVEGGNVLEAALIGFGNVRAMERELRELEQQLSSLRPGEAHVDELTRRYGELRHRFESLDGDRVEARAKAILSGLGIPARNFGEPLETLSGGWRMRVVLARLLLATPDLLLLDEPTNHLDLEAIDWLEGFLEGYDGAFIVVSHDRYFLNRMVQGIVEMERGRLATFAGNYDDYLERKEQREVALEKAARQQARELARVERFIERFRYKNTKAKQVQSRIRSLNKLERIDAPSRSKKIRFGFPPPPRSGDIVMRCEAVSKSYGSNVVYDRMDLLLKRGDRVALLGPNGAGKSTLLKLLAGRIAPDQGTIEPGHNVRVHYYAQHQLDALDPNSTVLEEIERVAAPGERPRMRKLLGCFLFSGEDVDKRVRVLSGGEKARLALARMLVRPVNLLLLDEPTNHLDLRSREMLEEALNEFSGTLVLISHDRYFINRVATSVADVGGGRVLHHPGDYDEYLAWKERRAEERKPEEFAPEPGPAATAREIRREERRREAEERNRLYRMRMRERDRLAPIEGEIATLEERVGELEQLQADPGVYSDPARAREVAREKAAAETRLETLYAEWEKLAAGLGEDGGSAEA